MGVVRAGKQKRPTYKDLLMLLEVKHYGQTASTTPAKAYLGMCFQLHTAGNPEALVLSGRLTDGSADLVTGAKYTVRENITPLSAHKSNRDDFCTAIEAGLKAVL